LFDLTTSKTAFIMRLSLGPIPPSRTLDAEAAGWQALDEQQPSRFAASAVLLAAPLLIASFFLLLGSKQFLRSEPVALIALLTFYAAMVPLHEALHVLCYPRGFLSDHLVVGAWPRHGLFYVLHDEPLPRRRLLVMLAAPLAVLSPALGCAMLAAGPGWQMVLAQMLLVHTAICSGDCLTIARIVLIHNSGWKTYWCDERTRPPT
jgi:hypothetical protein